MINARSDCLYFTAMLEILQECETTTGLKLIERILFLDGLPNLQDLHKILIGEDVREVLECDLKIEQNAIPELRTAIAYCETVSDYVSRDLFRQILEDEEHHVDYLETQLELIKRIGFENYQQLQV